MQLAVVSQGPCSESEALRVNSIRDLTLYSVLMSVKVDHNPQTRSLQTNRVGQFVSNVDFFARHSVSCDARTENTADIISQNIFLM